MSPKSERPVVSPSRFHGNRGATTCFLLAARGRSRQPFRCVLASCPQPFKHTPHCDLGEQRAPNREGGGAPRVQGSPPASNQTPGREKSREDAGRAARAATGVPGPRPQGRGPRREAASPVTASEPPAPLAPRLCAHRGRPPGRTGTFRNRAPLPPCRSGRPVSSRGPRVPGGTHRGANRWPVARPSSLCSQPGAQPIHPPPPAQGHGRARAQTCRQAHHPSTGPSLEAGSPLAPGSAPPRPAPNEETQCGPCWRGVQPSGPQTQSVIEDVSFS